MPRITLAAVLCVCLATIATAAPAEKLLALTKPQPWRPAALSPDGKHVGFTLDEGDKTFVVILALDPVRAVLKAEVSAQRMSAWQIVVPLLRWADSTRLLAQTAHDTVVVVDLAAGKARVLLDFAAEERVLGSEAGIFEGQVAVPVRRRVGLASTLNEPGKVRIVSRAFAGTHDRQHHLLFDVDIGTGKSEPVFDFYTKGLLVFDPYGEVRGSRTPNLLSPLHLKTSGVSPLKWPQFDKTFPVAGSPQAPMPASAYFGERSFPIAFDTDPHRVYFASNVGRDTYAIYDLDLRTGQRGAVAFENPTEDLITSSSSSAELLLDRAQRKVVGIRSGPFGTANRTLWLDPELAALEKKIEADAPEFTLRIVDWDDARKRFLVFAAATTSHGEYLLYSPATGELKSIVSLSGEQPPVRRGNTRPWRLEKPDGTAITGLLTSPVTPRAKPVPIVIRYQNRPWAPVGNFIRMDVLALAEMGFAVLEINHRGTMGYGSKHWLAGRHRIDEVVAEDTLFVLDQLAQSRNLDMQRVAVMGEDFGGYLALRTQQRLAGRIACAVALSPQTELEWFLRVRDSRPSEKFDLESNRWYFGDDRKRLKQQSPTTHAASAKVGPVFLSSVDGGSESRSSQAKALRKKLTEAGTPVTFREVRQQLPLPQQRADLYTQLEAFLGQHLAPASTAGQGATKSAVP